ncbi:MAG TPA: type II toxin-antitoxin system HicA family toxin [Acidimicrobiales bacterium]|nr:type II toxin-antitoxin system HicA family toxin [Acidimicrobiales bacterium]
MGDFPSMKAADLIRLLQRKLGYEVDRQKGSHRRLKAVGRPTLTFAFHDRQSLPPGVVRKVLVKDVGLSEEDAEGIL